ncbi:prepilin peptidase [Haloarculaceae archaeon H-GB2-1]|nr:A24 family peptidase C-terminal domain-containing protein [Haloarculaceae archaeon H-GB1-1]MEA5385716.1 prepilin peptidase [Haloarculaceae archaeon H-GB11]MEA5407218.1 prepilin peptidase [Haloarculaceae archaeon H-GB2-1]
MLGSVPDLLRLAAVPIFGWAAYRDVKTRRVPNRTWYPLVAIAAIALVWEGWQVWTSPLASPTPFALRVALSAGIVIPLAYGFWWLGGFGGADAKALIVIALLFPTFPTYYLPLHSLPLTRTTIGVFSMTILSNTVVVGVAYPLVLALRNLVGGHVGRAMFVGRPISWADAPTEYGRLLETPAGFSRSGLDLDALRMYLSYRGCTLAEIRADPDSYRDPASLPADPNATGDGSIPEEAAAVESADAPARQSPDGGVKASGSDAESQPDDPWGAAAFLDDIDHSAYGTTPEQLSDGLDVLVSEDDVWLSPGIPFIVPMFFGLLVSLVYGDVLFALVAAAGFA